MNYWYTQSLEVDHPRKGPFIEVINSVSEPIRCLVIGSERNITDPQAIYGDGFFSLYVADKILKDKTGSLTIVDIDPQAIENCKIIMSDFIGVIDIRFVVDDGLNWAGKDGFNLKYLDGGDESWQTFEMFKKVDLRGSHVLLDDFNPGGKCDRVKSSYPFYKTYKCGPVHQLGFYERMENYGNETFKIGDLELPYIREAANLARRNERSVELGLGKWFSENHPNLIEIGDVCPQYNFFKNWKVLDPSGPYSGCIRKDVMDLDYSGMDVLSLSTFEHMNNQEYKNNDPELCIKALKKVAAEAKNYLITIPIGGWRPLESFIKSQNDIKYTFLVRDNPRGEINNWTQSDDKSNFLLPYGHWDYQAGYYGNALSVCVITNQSEIF
jgi:hypothetical protein